jgi:hypothetical protein
MKILILHLTDLHIKEQDTWMNEKASSIFNVLKTDIDKYDKIFIVLTGDIAFSGKKDEYVKAKEFLVILASKLKQLYKEIRISIICVPGNHDCNFDLDTQARRNMLEKMGYQTIGDKDLSVIETCISIQKEFWDFYGALNTVPTNRLFYQLKDIIGNKRISFNCYNSAWMSQKNEVPGSLFYPIKKLNPDDFNEDLDISISVLHHPIAWFNPSTESNNRREIQEHLESTSSILIFGHEHYEDQRKVTDLHQNISNIYISGDKFQSDSQESSGFQTIKIDLATDTGQSVHYILKQHIYLPDKKEEFKLDNNNHANIFAIKPEFLDSLNKVTIPIQIEKLNDLSLTDIFVFPDIERIRDEYKKLDDFIDSENLIYSDNLNYCILEGENQSGKTSLNRILYRRFYELGFFPILVDGADITNTNYKKVIEKAYNNQYTGNLTFDHYQQLDNSKKIILIDDLQKIKLNKITSLQVIKEISSQFGASYVTVGSLYGYLSVVESELPNFNLFTIKPLGYNKRNELIERYHKLQESSCTLDDQVLLEKVKFSYNQVTQVLGNKLLPAYPIFILSILQTLSYAKSIDLEQTSYGYCYQSLIHIALASKAKVNNEKIDTYFNFLTELSFHLYERNLIIFSESEFQNFYEDYYNRFVTPPYEEIVEKLLDSHILINEEGSYKFSYKYIYYFLVAKKISDIISTDKGKSVVSDLFNNLQSEKNANILVFIAHHSKDNFLIESATFSSMVPFESIDPITLEKHDKFYDLIHEIAEEVSREVLDSNKNPKEERTESLKKLDEIERKNDIEHPTIDGLEEDNNRLEGDLGTFFQAFRSIEIVGQIIKNRKGSLEKTYLVTMIEELFLTGFRAINFFSQTLNDAKGDIINGLTESTEEIQSKEKIEKKINNFFQFITLQSCLGIFSKIVYSVGHKDLRRQFDEVADKIDTPAAKILSFSIKSYYDRMSIRELQKIADELKGNKVALKILRARVRAYVYNNYLDYKSKQKIAASLNMEITPAKK